MNSRKPLILAHGGAGHRCLTKEQSDCLAQALADGYGLLHLGASAALAVERTISLLEESGRFNAGRGSNRQLDGVRRMDASIMEGAGLKAGAVASLEGFLHPITVARLVMEKTDHVLLVGPSAGRFARHFRLKRIRTLGSTRRLPIDRYLAKLKRAGDRHGTVGAVALDRSGTVAAGASTGGIDSMLPGRVGDTPLIGCGVYADDRTGAVSMTGVGEGIIRLALAKAICDALGRGKSPQAAAQRLLDELRRRIRGRGGSLVLGADGRYGIYHVTPYMAAGLWNGAGLPIVKGRWR